MNKSNALYSCLCTLLQLRQMLPQSLALGAQSSVVGSDVGSAGILVSRARTKASESLKSASYRGISASLAARASRRSRKDSMEVRRGAAVNETK